MEKEEGIINKVKHFLRLAGMPKWLHRFGPKMYELWQHVFALFVKANCRLSYRRTTIFLRELGFKVATKSTLQRNCYKLKLDFWKKLLCLSLPKTFLNLVAVDGTGLERTQASDHYIKRIDGEKPFCKGFHFSILVDTKGKIRSLRLRKNYGHDAKDIKSLFRDLKQKPKTAVMDKGYDAEWIHEFLEKQGIHSIAPLRKGARKGFYRKKLKRNFPQKTYNKRSIVESIFHAFKQKFGSSVSSRKIGPARSEIYCKAIIHNILSLIQQLSGQTLKLNKKN